MSASTVLRLRLAAGGSLELVDSGLLPAVLILANAQHKYLSLDLSDAEIRQLATALGRLVAERINGRRSA